MHDPRGVSWWKAREIARQQLTGTGWRIFQHPVAGAEEAVYGTIAKQEAADQSRLPSESGDVP
jgi:hypothetical protein